jgi:hypothetical protein
MPFSRSTFTSQAETCASGNSKPSDCHNSGSNIFSLKESKFRFDSQETIQNDRISICPPVNPIRTGKFKAGRSFKKQVG